MSRTLYLICYDVADNNRRRRIHRLLSGYRVQGQRSVSECWLTASELVRVRQSIDDLISPQEDRVLIFRLDPRQAVRCFGKAETFTGGPFLIA